MGNASVQSAEQARTLFKTYPAAILRAQARQNGPHSMPSKLARARIAKARTKQPMFAHDDQETAIQLLASVSEVALWLQNYPNWVGYAWETETPGIWEVYFLAEVEGEWLGDGTVNIQTGAVLRYFVPRELTPDEYAEQMPKVESFLQTSPAVASLIGDAGDFWQRYIYYSRWETFWIAYYYYGLDAFTVVLKYNKDNGTMTLHEIYDPNQFSAEAQAQYQRDTAVALAWTAPGISQALEPYDNHQSTVLPEPTAGHYRVEFYADNILRFWALTDVDAYRLLDAQPIAGAIAPTVAPSVSGNDIVLAWAANAANDGYEVHRSPTPFFTPSAATLLATLPADRTSYTDVGAAGNPQLSSFYIVQAKAANQVARSNQIGAMRYALNNTGNQYTLIAVPFAGTGLTNAATLATYLGNVATLLKWNPATQSFRFFTPPGTGDNFSIAAGDTLFVQMKAGAQSFVIFTGNVAAVSYALTADGYNFLALPLQRSDLTTASQVAADLGHAKALLAWHAGTQAFRLFVPPSTGDNFALRVGQPFVALVDGTAAAIWPTALSRLGEPDPPVTLEAINQDLTATFSTLLHPQSATENAIKPIFMPLIHNP